MALILKLAAYLLCLFAVALSIPISLLEDIKDAQQQTPIRTPKVKRAQEVLMFGNQQNRAVNNYGGPRPEKRDIGDNTLAEDVATLPNILPQVEDQGYDTNQLGSGEKYEKSYPYIGREPNYGMILRNAALKESLHSDPVLGYGDLSLYNMMDARRKREAHKQEQPTPNNSYRFKRGYDLSPEEIVTMFKILASEPQRAQSRPAWHDVFGGGTNDLDLYNNQDDNDMDNGDNTEYNGNGIFMDGPVPIMGQSSRETGGYWPRKYKRFMVSKRRSLWDDGQLDSSEYSEGIPLQRRLIL